MTDGKDADEKVENLSNVAKGKNDEAENASRGKRSRKKKEAAGARVTLWVGIISSIITIILTAWNAYTKTQIDKREAELKSKALLVEESKERVTRYGWVKTLFPDLIGQDEKQQILTVNLIRLALTKEEAEQLFAGFKASSNKELRSTGQQGINAIENEEIAKLVFAIDDASSDVRKSAVAELERTYRSSSSAISLVLSLFDEATINNLSASGRINALYFLSKTDETAWTQQQILDAEAVIARLERRHAEKIAPMGDQTKNLYNDFKVHIARIKSQ